MFGGFGSRVNNLQQHETYHADNNTYGYNNQLFELSLGEPHTWSKPTTTGPTPTPRSGSAHAHINGVGYLFGGEGKDVCFNDLYSYHLRDRVWTHIQVSNQPPARSSSTMSTLDSNNIVICSGFNGRTCFSDGHRIPTGFTGVKIGIL